MPITGKQDESLVSAAALTRCDTPIDNPKVAYGVNPMGRRKFAGVLKNLRKQSGIGIKRLAPHLGVSYSYLSKLEHGITIPSEKLVYKTAEYFSCDPDSLLLAAGKVPPDVLRILQEHPEDALAFLKQRFGGADGGKRRS